MTQEKFDLGEAKRSIFSSNKPTLKRSFASSNTLLSKYTAADSSRSVQIFIDPHYETFHSDPLTSSKNTSSAMSDEELLSGKVVINDFIENPVQTFFMSVRSGSIARKDSKNALEDTFEDIGMLA